MTKADFDIQLLAGESTGITTYYRPGDLLRAQVTIFTDDEVKCRDIHARLLWYTEGRGTRYQEIVSEKSLFQGVLQAGFPNSYEFAFDLPRDPWSYEGHYVSVVWVVQIDIDIPWGKDIIENKRFILRPQLQEEN